MSVSALLADFKDAGILLAREGDDLKVRTNPGVSIAPYRDRIRQNKPAILVELLQREIEAAVTVEPTDFDHQHYDQLWHQWHTLYPPEIDANETSSPSTQSNLVPQEPIEATRPPASWDGEVCDECEWAEFCHALGPRGPHLPNGPCSAWPIEAAAHGDADDEPAIANVLAHLMSFTAEEVDQFRQEVDAAPDNDPADAIDREVLTRFDAQINHTIGVSA